MNGRTPDAALAPDLFDRAVLKNPYPTYAALREHAPVFWSPQLRAWVLTRFEDVLDALHNHDVYSSCRTRRIVHTYVDRRIVNWRFNRLLRPLMYRVAERKLAPFIELAEHFMWQQDPPNHGRLRKLMHTGFTMQMVERQSENIRNTVESLLDRMAQQAAPDFMSDFAMRLPAMIVADIFGMPDEWERLREWEDQLKLFLGGSSGNTGKTIQRMLDSVREMRVFFGAAIQARRADPGDDLISTLAGAEEAGYYFDDLELCANLIVTLGAAQVTTQDMLGNGLLALLSAPEQLELARAENAPLGRYIDELVRFDGPVQLTNRVLTRDVELHGQRMPKDSLVYLIRGAANRDSARFPQPDRLDLERDTRGHVAFGSGIHYCIGAALARREGEISFRRLFQRYPGIRLDPDRPITWRADSLQFRGLQSLPVVLH